MSLVVGYRGRYTPAYIPKEDVDEWTTTLQNAMTRIYNALLTRISDETAFRSYIAERAYDVWQDFVSPDWEERDLILLRYRTKLFGAYKKWLKGVVCAFHGSDPDLGITCEEGSPYFDDRVAEKKLKFAGMIKYTIGSTGHRYRVGRGIAVKAIGVISGMKRVVSDILSSDVVKTYKIYDPETGEVVDYSVTIPHDDFQGSVVNVFLPGAARFVRPQAIAIITEGMVNAQYAHEAGLASERDAILNVVNNYLANTVLKQVDTSKYDVKIGLKYRGDENKIIVCTDVFNAGERPADPSNWFCTELG